MRSALLCFKAYALSSPTVWSLWEIVGMTRCLRKSNLGCWIHPVAQSALGDQKCDSLVSVHSVGNRQTKVLWWGLTKLPCLEPTKVQLDHLSYNQTNKGLPNMEFGSWKTSSYINLRQLYSNALTLLLTHLL